MITYYKRKKIHKRVMGILVIGIITMGLAACTNSDTSSSLTSNNQGTEITIEDQKAFENTIEVFSKALEDKDYETAEKYCASDFKEYLENLINNQGPVTDTFSLAIVNNLPIKLVSVQGYYDQGEDGLDFNISEDEPTVNFLVTFEVQEDDGEKYSTGGYTQGVEGTDGEWLISGFASGR